MSAILVNLLIVGLVFATIAFTSVFGGRAERIGAAIYGSNVGLTWLAQVVAPDAWSLYVFLTLDLSAGAFFGVLAVRYPDRVWPGVAGVAQSLLVAFTATRAIGFPLSPLAYVAAINISSFVVKASLVGGAWNAWRARRSAGKDAVGDGTRSPTEILRAA